VNIYFTTILNNIQMETTIHITMANTPSWSQEGLAYGVFNACLSSLPVAGISRNEDKSHASDPFE